MRNIHFFAIASLALLTASCNFTDLEPTDKVNEKQVFQNLSTLSEVLNGVYSKASWSLTIGTSATLSDDVIKGGQNGGAHDDSYKWTYSASTGDHNDLWSGYYSVISEANKLIEGANGLSTNSEEEVTEKNNIIGNALFLRAYYSFDLLRFFSDFNDKEALGIPYSTSVVTLENLGRNTVQECYDDLLQDLTQAASLLKSQSSQDDGYACKDAALALMARIYLYEKDYSHAYQYAKDVLSRNPIATIDEYPSIWTDQSTKEVIFSLKRAVGDEHLGNVFFWEDKSSLFEPSTEFINSFSPDDTRLNCFIDNGFDRDNVPVKRIIKYKGITENVGLVNEKLLRSSEMQLIMAECMAYSDIGKANELLNGFRKNRIKNYKDTMYDNKEELLGQILLERRRELCFESHRFFDMRRFNLPISKSLINKTLDVSDYHRLMPIPLSELEANPTIASQQNPGYDNLK